MPWISLRSKPKVAGMYKVCARGNRTNKHKIRDYKFDGEFWYTDKNLKVERFSEDSYTWYNSDIKESIEIMEMQRKKTRELLLDYKATRAHIRKIDRSINI